MRTITIYARKSTESEDRQALSIESQIAELVSFAHGQGLEICRVYKEARSAKTTGRPEFNRMLKEIERNPGTVILCWSLDRLARNLQDAATLTQLMQDGVIQEIRTPRVSYGNTSMDLFISGLDFLIAKKYIDDLSENVRRGLRAKVQAGWRPSKPPLGHMTGGSHQTGRRIIVPDPRTFDNVRLLWNRMISCPVPLINLVPYAKSLGLELRLSTIHRLFSNPFYYGSFYWNGELFEGRHIPMISHAEFQKVQQYLHRITKRKRQRHSFLFSGLLRCTYCGSEVTAERKTKRLHSTGKLKSYTYYHCTRSKNPVCKARSIREDELCRQNEEYLQEIHIPAHEVPRRMNQMFSAELRKRNQHMPTLDSQNRELMELDHQISGLLSLKLSSQNSDSSLITDEEYKAEKNRLVSRRQCVRDEIANRDRVVGQVRESVAKRVRFAASARDRFKNGSLGEIKLVLEVHQSNQNEDWNRKKTLALGQAGGRFDFFPRSTWIRGFDRTEHFPSKNGHKSVSTFPFLGKDSSRSNQNSSDC